MDRPRIDASTRHSSPPLIDGDIAQEVDTVLRATISIVAVLIVAILASSVIGTFTQ